MLSERSVGPRAVSLASGRLALIPAEAATPAFVSRDGARFLVDARLPTGPPRARSIGADGLEYAVVRQPDGTHFLVTDALLRQRVLVDGLSALAPASEVVDARLPTAWTAGAGMSDGGICVTLRYLAAFGWLLATGGVSPTGEQVVPDWWIEDTARGAPDSREAFAISPTITLMPGGMYRNQFWSPYPDRDVLLGLGIHGQMVYVDRQTRLVAVKLSSWPDPQHAWKLFSTLRAFDAIAALYR